MLSIRPGGLRRQLRFVARRLRIMLVLGGVYVLVSSVLRLFAPDTNEIVPPLLALGLVVVFLFIARDPASA